MYVVDVLCFIFVSQQQAYCYMREVLAWLGCLSLFHRQFSNPCFFKCVTKIFTQVFTCSLICSIFLYFPTNTPANTTQFYNKYVINVVIPIEKLKKTKQTTKYQNEIMTICWDKYMQTN